MTSDCSSRCATETGGGNTCSHTSSQLASHHKTVVPNSGSKIFAQRGQPSTRPSGIFTKS